MTPKQATEALAMLDNLLQVVLRSDMDYRRRDDGIVECRTQWETLALFRLRSELVIRSMEYTT